MLMLKNNVSQKYVSKKIVWRKNVTSFYLPVIGKSFKLLNFVSIKIQNGGKFLVIYLKMSYSLMLL